MKKNIKKEAYSAPEIASFKINVERGYALTTSKTTPGEIDEEIEL